MTVTVELKMLRHAIMHWTASPLCKRLDGRHARLTLWNPHTGTFLPDVLFAFCIISKERVRKSLWNFAISSLGLILKEILTLVHGKCDNGPIHYLKHFEFLSHVTQQVSTTSRSNFWEILWETVALMRQYCIRRFPWPFHFLSRRARKHWCLHL